MAQINKQSRLWNPFKRDEFQAENYNEFDLSHDVKSTFKMGWLTPFMCMETLPKDTFTMRSEAMLRFAPLVLPIMHKCVMKMRYFYVPNRILWPRPNGWEDFIVGQDVEWAYTSQNNISNVIAAISSYMGLPNGGAGGMMVSPLPLAAYYKIYDEFYRNPNIQPERFVPVVAGNNTGTPIYNTASNPLPENWNLDYFTAALPMPQLGEDVLVPITAEGPWGEGTTVWNLDGSFPQALTGLSTNNTNPRRTRVDAMPDVVIDNQANSAPIRDLRLAIKLQEWLEKLNRTSQRYRDFLKGFFNSDPSPLQIDDPVYIGGTQSIVQISEVMQSAPAETSLGETPLGAYAGQALAFQDGKAFNYTCTEHGWIIGLISVLPKTSYYQGIHKKWSRESYLDYAYPQFAGIGDQAIKVKELNGNATTAELEDTWGYIPRYSEYRFENDIISGEMRNTFLDFHLARIFTNVPANFALNDTFLQCRPRVTDVFVLPGGSIEHEIYAHIFSHVKVRRNLPRYGIPQL